MREKYARMCNPIVISLTLLPAFSLNGRFGCFLRYHLAVWRWKRAHINEDFFGRNLN